MRLNLICGPLAAWCWLLSASACVCLAQESATSYRQSEDVVYGESDGVGLLMDVFAPTQQANAKAIVLVASGAFHSDRGKIRDLARARVFEIFCNRGYTVFAIRPGSITKFSALEMAAHVHQGVLWVKQHAPKYGIDATRLGLMGASAGGHLACLHAVTHGRSRDAADEGSVCAVGVFFPPTDFADYGGFKLDPRSNDPLGKLLRRLACPEGVGSYSDRQLEEKISAISPAQRVTAATPPFLLIHGDADTLVPLQQSQRMLAALQREQVPAELIIKKGGGHPWSTIHEEVAVMADWFDRRLNASDPDQ